MKLHYKTKINSQKQRSYDFSLLLFSNGEIGLRYSRPRFKFPDKN